MSDCRRAQVPLHISFGELRCSCLAVSRNSRVSLHARETNHERQRACEHADSLLDFPSVFDIHTHPTRRTTAQQQQSQQVTGHRPTHLQSFGGGKEMATALRTSIPAVTIPHPLVMLWLRALRALGWGGTVLQCTAGGAPNLCVGDLGFQRGGVCVRK